MAARTRTWSLLNPHLTRRPSSCDFRSKICFRYRQAATPLTGNDLAACRFSEVNALPLRSRRSSFLSFSASAFFLSTRQMPASFDVVATVSAFYVSRAVTPVIDLSRFDVSLLDTREA